MIESFVQLKKKKIGVIGDFMLDSYTKGSVKRISPEAPVCVLKVSKQQMQPGGAGNVVLNCLALGAEVCAFGRIGSDYSSGYLKSALHEAGANTSGLIYEKAFETPLKNRFMAGYQQLLRVDFENEEPATLDTKQELLTHFKHVFPSLDLVLISDYNKGLLSKDFLKDILDLCHKLNLPVFVDPKGHDFSKYKGATLIKPNLSEAYLASGLDEKASLEDVANVLMNHSSASYLLITRSEKGMSLFDKDQRQDFPAMAKEVIDVTGAGDTVISTLAVAFASGLELSSCVTLSNIAASCAIEKLGCVHVGKKELAKAVSKIDPKFKHTFCQSEDLFQMLLDDEKVLLIDLKDQKIDIEFLLNLSKYRSYYPQHVLIVVVPSGSSANLITSLTELVTVDFIIPESLAYSLQNDISLASLERSPSF